RRRGGTRPLRHRALAAAAGGVHDPAHARIRPGRGRGGPRLGYRLRVVTELTLIPREEFDRAGGDLALVADMCRANALVAVKRAGSGHLGSSFSALDVVVTLLWRELSVAELGWDHPDRVVFFSSKGPDVPGLHAA